MVTHVLPQKNPPTHRRVVKQIEVRFVKMKIKRREGLNETAYHPSLRANILFAENGKWKMENGARADLNHHPCQREREGERGQTDRQGYNHFSASV